jgi:hypothetical protein
LIELNEKIWANSLSEVEHLELMLLNDAHEKWAAKRITCLAELAVLRNTDYMTLTRQLGINLSHQNG